MATDEEKAALANVLVDTSIGGIHFHARFASERVVEYFVNKRKVSEEIYDRMLTTARAVSLDIIATGLGEDGQVIEQLSYIVDALHGGHDDENGGWSIATKLEKLIQTVAEHD